MKRAVLLLVCALAACESVSLEELSAMSPAERNAVEPSTIKGARSDVRQEAIACVNKHKDEIGVDTTGDVPKDYRDACWRIYHVLNERWEKREREKRQAEALRAQCGEAVLVKDQWGRYRCVSSVTLEGW